jgi:PhzF family phenazine biosynthesis protein
MSADVGYSESAFLVARPDESNVYDVRYFSPKREVPFCGHATIAAAVALAERSPAAELIFHTPAGFVSVTTFQNDHGETVAELTSVAPRVSEPDPDLLQGLLDALRWSAEDLDPDYPVRLANAGSEHLVLVTKTRKRLADLDYDFRRSREPDARPRVDYRTAGMARVEEAISLPQPICQQWSG